MIHNNIFLWNWKYIQLLMQNFKSDFCHKLLGFFKIEEEYLMIEHNKDRCQRGIHTYIWNTTIVLGSLVWELSDKNSQDKEQAVTGSLRMSHEQSVDFYLVLYVNHTYL